MKDTTISSVTEPGSSERGKMRFIDLHQGTILFFLDFGPFFCYSGFLSPALICDALIRVYPEEQNYTSDLPLCDMIVGLRHLGGMLD